MGAANWLGILLFFVVPVLLWAAFIFAIKFSGTRVRPFGLLIGSDNRLSLSRAQALAWTLVIFGSWICATVIHRKINADHAPTDKAAADSSKAVAQKAVTDAKAKQQVAADQASKAARERDHFAKKEDAGATVYDAALKAADREITAAKQAVADATVEWTARETELKSAPADKKKEIARDDAKTKLDQAMARQKSAEDSGKSIDEGRAKAQAALEASASNSKRDKEDAEADLQIAESTLQGLTDYDWVQIPAALLALAAIAIGSGVFSSLIAAVNSEESSASIAGIQSADLNVYLQARREQPDLKQSVVKTILDRTRQIPDVDAATKAATAARNQADLDQTAATNARKAADAAPADAALQDRAKEAEATAQKSKAAAQAAVQTRDEAELRAKGVPSVLVISGAGMKKAGTVRFKRTFATIREWSDDGTVVIADIPAKAAGPLVVDTGNGKLSYGLEGQTAKFSLGQPAFQFDASDFFREDKNPAHFDLMKFQMFGWTAIAILVYGWLFLTDLNDHIASLPTVDQTIVMLTGLSQAGYLTAKGISNVNKPDPTKAAP